MTLNRPVNVQKSISDLRREPRRSDWLFEPTLTTIVGSVLTDDVEGVDVDVLVVTFGLDVAPADALALFGAGGGRGGGEEPPKMPLSKPMKILRFEYVKTRSGRQDFSSSPRRIRLREWWRGS
jgi:hypothetical protein